MNYIPFFFPDFKRLIGTQKSSIGAEVTLHQVTFYEDGDIIYFHKPVGSFLYYTTLDINKLPEDIDLKTLKIEWGAIQIPEKLIKPFTIKVIADDS